MMAWPPLKSQNTKQKLGALLCIIVGMPFEPHIDVRKLLARQWGTAIIDGADTAVTPEIAQDGPMMCQASPKMAPEATTMAPRWPKTPQDGPKMATRWPQEAPRWPQDGPMMR